MIKKQRMEEEGLPVAVSANVSKVLANECRCLELMRAATDLAMDVVERLLQLVKAWSCDGKLLQEVLHLYHIRKERNRRCFTNEYHPSAVLIRTILDEVVIKVSSSPLVAIDGAGTCEVVAYWELAMDWLDIGGYGCLLGNERGKSIDDVVGLVHGKSVLFLELMGILRGLKLAMARGLRLEEMSKTYAKITPQVIDKDLCNVDGNGIVKDRRSSATTTIQIRANDEPTSRKGIRKLPYEAAKGRWAAHPSASPVERHPRGMDDPGNVTLPHKNQFLQGLFDSTEEGKTNEQMWWATSLGHCWATLNGDHGTF
ncbi:hypothetical protein HHK36_006817 [Tetracentron sinense]|uniref:Uncharacterized protein n=1 Tax=Tetracentron sinense TaxID=13715 RepID=A0A834ZJN9_TETSI|nr:hypothetical protein HHK36_006817 [Tetracentron sinense]